MKPSKSKEKLPFVVVDATELTEGEREFAAQFGSEVIGQPEVSRIAQMVYNAYKNPLRDRNRPIGVYYLIGKSRTGKSKTARALAKIFHGDEEALTRISASSYEDDHEMSDLKGAPPSYIGYRDPKDPKNHLEAHEVDPYSVISPHNMLRVRINSTETIDVIVIEEFEKGCFDFWKLWMDIFDRGQLKLRNGQVANFHNAVIILTSNLATEAIEKAESGGIGFARNARKLSFVETKDIIEKVMTTTYKKEFRNRLDAVVVFRDLDEKDIAAIVDAEIKVVEERILEQMPRGTEFSLDVEPSARKFLLAHAGGEVAELKRQLERHVMQPLGRLIGGGKIRGGDLVRISHEGEAPLLAFAVAAGAAGMSEADGLDEPYGGDTPSTQKGLSFQRRVDRAKRRAGCDREKVSDWAVTVSRPREDEFIDELRSLMHDIKEIFGAKVTFVGSPLEAPWVGTLTIKATEEQIALIKEKYDVSANPIGKALSAVPKS